MLRTDELLERSAEATGLDDFGAPTFRLGLDRLVHDLNGPARLSEGGRARAAPMILGALRNRLRVEHWWSEDPELGAAKIERPIFIVGMSRSGTTTLSHLLGKDERLRSLLRWEAMDSVPPPESATYWTDPRYLATVDFDEQHGETIPGLWAIHYDPPSAPFECNMLFAHEFVSSMYTTTFPVPNYFDWMLAADHEPVYGYHARMLRLLQSRAPGRWNLKTLQHALALPALRAQYPDAVIIATHRDPAICAASTASLMAFLHAVSSDDPRPVAAGAMAATLIERCADGLVADAAAGNPVIHVPYPELVGDPMATVRRIYEEMGTELSAEAEAAMRDQVKTRTQHRYGVHHYDFADYGMDKAELDDRYRAYRERFDIALESRRS